MKQENKRELVQKPGEDAAQVEPVAQYQKPVEGPEVRLYPRNKAPLHHVHADYDPQEILINQVRDGEKVVNLYRQICGHGYGVWYRRHSRTNDLRGDYKDTKICPPPKKGAGRYSVFS